MRIAQERAHGRIVIERHAGASHHIVTSTGFCEGGSHTAPGSTRRRHSTDERTPMHFPITTLIEAVDAALAADAETRSRRAAVEREVLDEYACRWDLDQRPRWVAYRDALTSALRNGGRITADNLPTIPDAFAGTLANYGLSRKVSDRLADLPYVTDRQELHALKGFLGALDRDTETVSAAQLSRCGFASTVTARVFRVAASGAAS